MAWIVVLLLEQEDRPLCPEVFDPVCLTKRNGTDGITLAAEVASLLEERPVRCHHGVHHARNWRRRPQNIEKVKNLFLRCGHEGTLQFTTPEGIEQNRT